MRGLARISVIRGDLSGGATATFLSLPEAMAYGTIVFAPLGPNYISLGVVSGLIALCFSNLSAAWCGGVRVMHNGPYSLTSLMLASSVTILSRRVPDGNIDIVLGLLFLIIFFCGLFQMLFGLLRVAALVKYIPYPVTSGLLNGTAIIIFFSQVRSMLGMPDAMISWDVSNIQPLTLVVGLVTIAVIWHGEKLTKKISPFFLGIGAGTILYYLLSFSGFRGNLGSTIGAIPFMIPTPKYAANFWEFFGSTQYLPIIAELTSLSLGIAIIASLQSLIASVDADNRLKERSNTNRELVGQGLGNLVSSLFGGIVSAGSQSRTMANVINGGRTANSRFAGGLTALAVLLLFSPLIAELPKVVFAATLVVLALKIFDAWSFRLLSMLFSKKARLKQLLPDLSVVLLVVATLLLGGVFKAVGAGILISVLLFILRMGKDIIRREYDGTRIRSNVHRSLEEITYLEENGKKIKVFELEGSLFFGTADKIVRVVDHAMETEAVYIVVDLRHVSDIDSTGANILVRIRDRCRDKHREMVLSSVNLMRDKGALSTSLSILEGSDQYENRHSYFDTIDEGLAWAEDRLLDERFGTDRYDKKLPLSQLDILREFSDSECLLLSGYLAESVLNPGEVILEQGSSGDRIYFLLQGKVQVVIDLRHRSGSNRIATLCPGTVFGEMAIIDQGSRSANVVAQTHVSCCYMTTSELVRLNREYPELSHKLMIGFAREISRRVRILNRTITELKG